MTHKETIRIMAVLQGAYPNYYKGLAQDELPPVVSLWQDLFADEPYQLVAYGVKAFIAADVKGFPPTIGQIKESIRLLSQPKELTPLEAWQLVQRAAANSAYHAKREFAALPPQVQELVGSAEQLYEWSQMEADTLISVVGSNFQRSYRTRAQEIKQLAKLPSGVKQVMAALQLGETPLALTEKIGE